jgi:hypothetical protein
LKSSRNINEELRDINSGRKTTGAIIGSSSIKKLTTKEPHSELFTGKFSNTYAEGTLEFPLTGLSTPVNNMGSHRKTF